MGGLSLAVEGGDCPRVAVHGLLFVRISCRAQAVGVQASVVAARGLSGCGLWAPEPRSSGAQA